MFWFMTTSKILKSAGSRRPPAAGKGRKKGVPNKHTQCVREMVLAALDGVGGQEYLQRQARENPNAFLSLVAKTMPTKVVGDPENPVGLVVTHRVELDFNNVRAKRATAAL